MSIRLCIIPEIIHNSEMYRVKIKENLKRLMMVENITQADLAKRIGTKQPNIQRVLSGEIKSPKLELLIPLSIYFGITLDQLVGIKEIREQELSYIRKENAKTAENRKLEPLISAIGDLPDSSIDDALSLISAFISSKYSK